MPIRPEWRKYYGKDWHALRMRILARAKHRCEECQVPDRLTVLRGQGNSWKDLRNGHWYSPDGLAPKCWSHRRMVTIVLTVAHLNHDPQDNRPENLRALCQWCHLNYDKLHHAESRAARKDRARPLLRLEGAAWCGSGDRITAATAIGERA